SIIDDLLDAAKLQGGQYALKEERVSIRECIETCLRMIGAHPDSAGLVLERDIQPGLPPLLADRRLLTQMLLNLLGNAAKFTKAGGSIRIEARNGEDAGLVLAVHDSGIGIAKEDIAEMLRPFRRSKEAHVRGTGGAGLGLPLVKGAQ